MQIFVRKICSKKLLTTENMFDNIITEQLFATCVWEGEKMDRTLSLDENLFDEKQYYNRSELRIRKNKIRRQRIVRRQIVLLSFTIALFIFLLSFLFISFMTDAQTDDYRPEFKYYKTVTVHSDETMWDIARTNYSEAHYKNLDDYIAEICAINSIGNANKINAGESLVVPYYSETFK